MKRISVPLAILLAGLCALVGFILPSFALAAQIDDVGSQTRQVIPPGGLSCPPNIVTSITPYIYDNELHSFDVNISDTSYVALIASDGEAFAPFWYMTRRINPDGTLRIHVDIQSRSLASPISIALTLLSSRPGLPTCLSIISFGVTGSYPLINDEILSEKSPGAESSRTKTDSGSPSIIKETFENGTPQGPEQGSRPAAIESRATSSSVVARLNDLCAGSGALWVWLVLLVLYIVAAAFTALAQPPLAHRNTAIPVAIMLVPLVVLIGLWYFSPGCRSSNWVPLALLAIAVAGLLGSFRERIVPSNVIHLPPAKQ